MTRLELLGFMVASARWLELRRQDSAMLTQLVAAHPRVIKGDCFVGSRGEVLGRLTAQSKMAKVRRALAEVGFAGSIETVVGVGYRFVGDVEALKAEVELRA